MLYCWVERIVIHFEAFVDAEAPVFTQARIGAEVEEAAVSEYRVIAERAMADGQFEEIGRL
jgi:hypothetical protein